MCFYICLDVVFTDSNVCTSRGVTTCHQCLAVHPSCAWCSQEVKKHTHADTHTYTELQLVSPLHHLVKQELKPHSKAAFFMPQFSKVCSCSLLSRLLLYRLSSIIKTKLFLWSENCFLVFYTSHPDATQKGFVMMSADQESCVS